MTLFLTAKIMLPPLKPLTESDLHTMNYERIYAYRFAGISPEKKMGAWAEIAPWVHDAMGKPKRVLDPAAGDLEFLSGITSEERWAVDLQTPRTLPSDGSVRYIQGDIFTVELPMGHFDGVFISNFLEHLKTPDDVQRLLTLLYDAMAPGARIAVMGPNFRYCGKEYFDCADHYLALTNVAIEEHLFASGFEIHRSIPRFLPYSFRSSLPPIPILVRSYLNFPRVWPLLGKQFLVIAEKPHIADALIGAKPVKAAATAVTKAFA